MIAEVYIYVYLFFCTIFLISYLKIAKIPTSVGVLKSAKSNPQIVIFLFFLILWVGFRPISRVFSDTVSYNDYYEYYFNGTFVFQQDTDNLIFDNLLAFFASMGIPISIFFTFIATIYFVGISLSVRKLFPENYPVALFSYLVAFSTFSYATDGIKAGAAASLFLMVIANRKNILIAIIFAFLSISFHHSMKVVVIAFIIVTFIKNTKIYFWGWCFATFIAVAHIGYFQELFSTFVDDERQREYFIQGVGGFETGFRPDFILYSAMPIFVGYIMYFRRKIRDENYEFLLRLYLMTNSVWMLCMYASYSNRFAYMSWFMYPFVLLYPYLAMYWRDNQLQEGRKVVIYHMLFTIFMAVVYYGFMR